MVQLIEIVYNCFGMDIGRARSVHVRIVDDTTTTTTAATMIGTPNTIELKFPNGLQHTKI